MEEFKTRDLNLGHELQLKLYEHYGRSTKPVREHQGILYIGEKATSTVHLTFTVRNHDQAQRSVLRGHRKLTI